MPSIDRNATFVTQINHIKVDPKNQDALVQRMTEQIDEVAVKQPGFISSTIQPSGSRSPMEGDPPAAPSHKSRDGHHVVNYVQWESTDLLDAFHKTPEFQTHFQTYKDYVLEAGPVVYDIIYSQEA